MRKYMQPVFDAFLAKKARKAPAILGHDGERHVTLWTDGKTLYSYAMPIARHVNGWLYLVSTEQSPSRTTTAQMRCLRERIPSDVPVQFVDALSHLCFLFVTKAGSIRCAHCGKGGVSACQKQ